MKQIIQLIIWLTFGLALASAQGAIVTDMDASASVTGFNLVGDHALLVTPNFDATDETFQGNTFFTIPENLWNYQVVDLDGVFVTTNPAEFVEMTIDGGGNTFANGEMQWVSGRASWQQEVRLLGGATWATPGAWTIGAPDTITLTGIASGGLPIGNSLNPTWTGEATGFVARLSNMTVFSNGASVGLGFDATITSVPEPSGAVMLLTILGTVALRRRRRTN